jgi:hypothetical protein
MALIFVGFKGWQFYKEWKERGIKTSQELKTIELLQKQQGIILTLSTELAEIQKKVVGETLKEKVTVKVETPTYESKKAEIIELKKEPEVNQEKIDVARAEFEERINEFQASPDKILINTGDGKIVLYEDTKGNLVSLESGVTITRHRNVEEVIGDLQAGNKIEVIKGKDYNLSFNLIYDSTDKDFYPGVSYQLWDWKKFSFNVTGYDFSNVKAGIDLCYNISDNIVIGAGLNLFNAKDFEFALDKYYLKAGIEFSF